MHEIETAYIIVLQFKYFWTAIKNLPIPAFFWNARKLWAIASTQHGVNPRSNYDDAEF